MNVLVELGRIHNRPRQRANAVIPGPRRTRKVRLMTDDTRRIPPLTADEAAWVQESLMIDRLIVASSDDDDIDELLRRRVAVLTKIRDSRLRTWDEWLTNGGAA